jgi:predicted ArsR family transcriptional regulator
MSMELSVNTTAPQARRFDPATSHEAAASARDLQARHHELIVDTLRRCGPLGKDRIAEILGLTGVAVARRMSELREAGLVAATGRRVPSNSGRSETEWKAI